MPVGSSLLGDLLIVRAVTGGRSPRVTKKKKPNFILPPHEVLVCKGSQGIQLGRQEHKQLSPLSLSRVAPFSALCSPFPPPAHLSVPLNE